MASSWILPLLFAESPWVSLETYMEKALYHPEKGYYSSGQVGLGAKGDFSTAATLCPLLSKAIFSAWQQAQEELGCSLSLIEVGGGEGSLAAGIKSQLGFWQRRKTPYFLIEKSPALQKIQKKRAGSFITHKNSLQEALQATEGRAFIFSNELVDAFSPRQFFLSPAGQWQELGLICSAKRLLEAPRFCPPEELPHSTLFSLPFSSPQRIEVHESYQRWLQDWAPFWTTGRLLTLDYGQRAQKLYERAPFGSFRGYKNHHRLTAPALYSHSGFCDLTCDVNFSDLILWGQELGWQTHSLQSQGEFLSPFCNHPPTEKEHFLCDQNGAGSAFQVLLQEKD